MYYIYVVDGVVHESIPDYNPVFPGIPADARYTSDFLAKCIKSEIEVAQGWSYDAETGAFLEPPDPVGGTYSPPGEPESLQPTADPLAALDALAVDHELRITLLELGV